MTSTEREKLLSIIETKATMDEPMSAFTIARALGKNDPAGQIEINTHIRNLLNDGLLVQKPHFGSPCYYLKSQQVEEKPKKEGSKEVPAPAEYAEDDEVDENDNSLNGNCQPDNELVEAKEEEPAEGFQARCGKSLPSLRGQHVHEGLCTECKAMLPGNERGAVGATHFKECRFGCGKRLAPQGIWRHEMYCPKRPADQPRVRETVMVTAEELVVAEYHGAADPPKPAKRYKLNTHVNDIVVDSTELHTEVEWLLEHGVKEITIKEVG